MDSQYLLTIFLILYLVIGPIIVSQFTHIDFKQYWLTGSTPALACLIHNTWQALYQKEEDNPLRPISCKSKDDVLKKAKTFILYLRGFQSDDYSNKFTLEAKGDFESFSEYKLVKKINGRIPIYAVGMTKETYSPIGANRIYLDDTSWKKDVRDLMFAAKKIVILVDDKENCIWEIEQTNNLKDKTVFIVNDYYKYLMARFKLNQEDILPTIEDEQYHDIPFYFTTNDDRLNIHKISSNYKELANFITR